MREQSDQEILALSRIQKGACPICGKDLVGDVINRQSVIVMDARFGRVRVCETHNVAKAKVSNA